MASKTSPATPARASKAPARKAAAKPSGRAASTGSTAAEEAVTFAGLVAKAAESLAAATDHVGTGRGDAHLAIAAGYTSLAATLASTIR